MPSVAGGVPVRWGNPREPFRVGHEQGYLVRPFAASATYYAKRETLFQYDLCRISTEGRDVFYCCLPGQGGCCVPASEHRNLFYKNISATHTVEVHVYENARILPLGFFPLSCPG